LQCIDKTKINVYAGRMIQKIAACMIVFSVCFFSCKNSPSVESVKEDELFSLSYGRFEDQLNMFDLADIGNVHTSMTMRDGFFYIANGEAEKDGAGEVRRKKLPFTDSVPAFSMSGKRSARAKDTAAPYCGE